MKAIPTHKEVTIKRTLHYYKAYYSPCINGQYKDTFEYLFKTIKRPSQIGLADVAKVCNIKMAQWDCLNWAEIDMEKYLKGLPEI